jgi:hypothetical protein
MDAVVVSSMITAGAKIGTWLFDKWSGQPSDKEAQSFIDEHYDVLRGLTSDNCMRLLKRMEDGQNRSVDDLLAHLYPGNALVSAEYGRLRSEFEYRLFFMSLAGLVIRPTREFYVTEVGKAFLNKARERRDYFKVLFAD